jgi:hypothetical protein
MLLPFFWACPAPVYEEAGLHTTAPADLAARAEADGIILDEKVLCQPKLG